MCKSKLSLKRQSAETDLSAVEVVAFIVRYSRNSTSIFENIVVAIGMAKTRCGLDKPAHLNLHWSDRLIAACSAFPTPLGKS